METPRLPGGSRSERVLPRRFFSAFGITTLGLAMSHAFAALPSDIGPQSPVPDLSRYAAVFYVDAHHGDDVAGTGAREKPWASLPHALEHAGVPPANQRTAILVSEGRYIQPTLLLKPRVDLFGGFAGPGGARDVINHATLLDGEETHRIAFGADDARVDGFHFVNGRVRGKGAALFCDGTSPTIANCVFRLNRTLIPQPWQPKQLHETAHDGGALFVTNGAAPRIEHGYFFDNTTECSRGAAIAVDRRGAPRIVASVFANNRSGLDDPFRSSDGGAISFFDWSAGEVSGCVLSANVSFTRNDAGGVFVALWSSPKITDNVFVANDGGDEWGPRDTSYSSGFLDVAFDYGRKAGVVEPPPLREAADRVITASKAAKVFILDNVRPENVTKQIDAGIMIAAGGIKEAAEIGRQYTKRTMP